VLGISKLPNQIQNLFPALIDTGFDDYLMISRTMAKQLDLKIIGEQDVELATGENYLCQYVEADVFFADKDSIRAKFPVMITESNESIIGTKLLSTWFYEFAISFKKSQIKLKYR
jgi:clan AA aspartic protease